MPSLYAAKMALCQGLWRIFSIKKYPSTIRWENGVLISPFCVSFSENFLALTICGQNEVFAPPQANFSLIFLPPTIRRQNRVFAPPSSAYFSKKILVPHYTRRKSQFINPLAEDFVQKICPSLYAGKNAFWQPPILKKCPHIYRQRERQFWQDF